MLTNIEQVQIYKLEAIISLSPVLILPSVFCLSQSRPS
jgi:hypothetical protein